MSEYIEKGKLIDYVQDTYGGGNEDNTCIWYGNVIEMIRSEPAAEVVPVKHGKWIENPFLIGTSRFCSSCGSNYGMPHEVFNYCPHCGAKMILLEE